MKKQQPERIELERVARSREFSRATQLRRLLIWLCERKLSGDTASLTEHAIGVGPLGRKADFDPRIDAIVRKEMARLREKLDAFYSRSRESAALRIVIEKGSYEPRFEPNAAVTRGDENLFRILVLPFREIGDVAGLHHLNDDLTDLLVAHNSFRVAPHVLAEHCRQHGVSPLEPLRKAGVDWLVEGTVRKHEGTPTAGVRLISVNDGFAVATWRFDGDNIAERIASAIEEKLRS